MVRISGGGSRGGGISSGSGGITLDCSCSTSSFWSLFSTVSLSELFSELSPSPSPSDTGVVFSAVSYSTQVLLPVEVRQSATNILPSHTDIETSTYVCQL